MDHTQNSKFYQKYFHLSQFLLALNRRKNLWREFNQRKTRTKKWFESRATRGTNIRKDLKATSEHGQFFIVNVVGKSVY
jgi:hypothetical protein